MPDKTALATLDKVILQGDLSTLTSAEKLLYYAKLCESVHVNPLTKPFQYLQMDNKLVLYATKTCTDQLRAIHSISISPPVVQLDGGLIIVTVTAIDKGGRTDSDVGAVPIEGLKGPARANAIKKAVTQGKRRVTLSICGLGMLDETEVDDIPGATRMPAMAAQIDSPQPLAISEGDRASEQPADASETPVDYQSSSVRMMNALGIPWKSYTKEDKQKQVLFLLGYDIDTTPSISMNDWKVIYDSLYDYWDQFSSREDHMALAQAAQAKYHCSLANKLCNISAKHPGYITLRIWDKMTAFLSTPQED